jgi:hypothetical protein
VFPSLLNLFLARNFNKNELHFEKKFPLMAGGGHESCIHQFLLESFVTSALIGRKYKKKLSLLGLFLSWHLLCIVI